MIRILFTAALCWLSLALAGPIEGTRNRNVLPAPVQAGFRDAVSPHAIPMRKHDVAESMSHPAMRRRANRPVPLKNIYDVYYSIDLKVGNQTIAVSVDTGSSDTWMVQQPYECVSFWFDPTGVSYYGCSVLELRLWR